ncbi:rubrerythrin [Thermococcus sp. P6]|nr:rubrerythrin [Thermococcus sp. P6]
MYDVDEIIEGLARLGYDEVLAYWIKGEREEAGFYRELATRARDLGLGEEPVKTFEKLSEDSLNHARELERYLKSRYGDNPVKAPDLQPIEVLPVIDGLERADRLEEVLRFAMESELIAHRSYRALAERVDDPELAELYRKLAEVEKGHYEMLRKMYEEIKERRG